MQKRLFYGWVIVGAGCLVMAVGMGMVVNAFGIFIVPVCEEFGFSRGQMNLNQSLFMAGGMLVALLAGGIYKRLPMKWILRVSALVLVAAYNLYPLARSLAAFYLLSAVCAISYSLCTQMPMSILLNNWFHEKRGLAVGITFMGSGLGGMAFSALGGVLLPLLGWRGTVTVFGLCLAVVLLPCVFFVLKEKPADLGLFPLGERHAPGADAAAQGATLGQMLRSPWFYALLLTLAGFGLCLNTTNATMASHMFDAGYGKQGSAFIASLYLGAIALGKIALGALYDRWGLRRATLAVNLCIVVQFVCMYFAHIPLCMVGCIVCCGFGNSFGSVAQPVMAQSLYGSREYATATGFIMAANYLGSAIGPTLGGAVYDMTGSYRPAFGVMIAVTALLALVLHLCFAAELRKGHNREK